MYKLSLNAGHGYNTAGKRCSKIFDKNETREYVLNKRVCDKIQNLLSLYENISIQRIDNGKDIKVSNRCKHANNFGADFYLSIHHNAGVNGGVGGGVMCFCYTKVDTATKKWQKCLYDNVIATTQNKGNRSNPLSFADFGELRETKMPAVLIECGFMDSATDTPKILTSMYAEQVAVGCVNAIVKMWGLKLKVNKVSEKINTTQSDLDVAKDVIKGKYGNGEERKNKISAIGKSYSVIQKLVNKLLGAK